MLRKYFKQKISQPAREKGWALGEKFGKMTLPVVLLLYRIFNAAKKRSERRPRLTVSLLLLALILNTLVAISFSYHRNKTAIKPDAKAAKISVIKAPRHLEMDMMGQQAPDIGRLKSIRDSLQFFKEKRTWTAQDSIAVLGLLKTVASLNKNYKHP
jgi:hypothetical protein